MNMQQQKTEQILMHLMKLEVLHLAKINLILGIRELVSDYGQERIS